MMSRSETVPLEDDHTWSVSIGNMKRSIRVTHVLLLLVFLQLTVSLPLREENENFQSHIRHEDDFQFPEEDFGPALLEASIRHVMAAGLQRRRQLGDLEFSSRYTDFLRSKAKHSSICTLLQRMQTHKKSAVGADMEKINQLLKQYRCPFVYDNWLTEL